MHDPPFRPRGHSLLRQIHPLRLASNLVIPETEQTTASWQSHASFDPKSYRDHQGAALVAGEHLGRSARLGGWGISRIAEIRIDRRMGNAREWTTIEIAGHVTCWVVAAVLAAAGLERKPDVLSRWRRGTWPIRFAA